MDLFCPKLCTKGKKVLLDDIVGWLLKREMTQTAIFFTSLSSKLATRNCS